MLNTTKLRPLPRFPVSPIARSSLVLLGVGRSSCRPAARLSILSTPDSVNSDIVLPL